MVNAIENIFSRKSVRSYTEETVSAGQVIKVSGGHAL